MKIPETTHLYTRALLAAEIIYHSDSLAYSMFHEYFSGICGIEFVSTADDRLAIITRENDTLIVVQGTKDKSAWVSDAIILTADGFHMGIKKGATDIIKNHVSSLRKDKKVWVFGHSRGDAISLYINKLLKENDFHNVESVVFSGPYIANDEGVEKLKELHVCHTHIETDGVKGLPSDPTDDAGGIKCRHYGEQIKLEGTGGVFDHAPSQVAKNLAVWFAKKDFSRYITEIEWLLTVCQRVAHK